MCMDLFSQLKNRIKESGALEERKVKVTGELTEAVVQIGALRAALFAKRQAGQEEADNESEWQPRATTKKYLTERSCVSESRGMLS